MPSAGGDNARRGGQSARGGRGRGGGRPPAPGARGGSAAGGGRQGRAADTDRQGRAPRRSDRSASESSSSRPGRDRRGAAPPIDADVSGGDLDAPVRQELRSLPKTLAEEVAKHLVMTARLLDEDADAAYRHTQVARRLASRVAAVREAAGLAAYATGRFAEALTELRAARRMSGSDIHLPVLADCERGLGRPERALALAASPAARTLDTAGRVELRIVAAGARRDLGQLDAAVVTLQGPELNASGRDPWIPRLRYAYADALLAAGRAADAQSWFARAVEADAAGETDAADRLAELEGTVFVDAEEPFGEAAESQSPDPEAQPSAKRGGVGQ